MNNLKVIARRELFRVASLNSMSVVIKIGIGLLTSKAIAIFLGPSGMALTGNLRNFLTTIENLSILGFQNGIVKYVSAAKDDDALKRFLSTVVTCLLVSVAILSSFLFVLSGYLNDMLFGSIHAFSSVFQALALGLPWYVASMFFVTVLNGLGKFRSVIYINILGNIIGFAVSLILIVNFRVYGALLGIVIAPSLLFLITVFFIRSHLSFRMISFSQFSFPILGKLSEFSLMALVSAVLGPIVILSIRTNVITQLGIEKAGMWEGILRLSSYYLLFVSTMLTVYFLPRLAKSRTDEEMRSVFMSYFKGIIPIFVVGLALVYLFRGLIVQLLFSAEFTPMTELFFWQLAGDLLKALSLILGYAFFARKLTKAFIITELFSLLVLWLSSRYLITIFDIKGVVMAHALTYTIYLIVLIIYFRKTLFGNSSAG